MTKRCVQKAPPNPTLEKTQTVLQTLASFCQEGRFGLEEGHKKRRRNAEEL
jgi:hypothetical protein